MINLDYHLNRDILVIKYFKEMSNLDMYTVLSKFFNSNTYNAMEHELASMQNMNSKYLASELMCEYGYETCLGYSPIKGEEEIIGENILVDLNK